MNKVSVMLIVKNEEYMLPHCLLYLSSLDAVDDICIVDDGSTDRTKEIAQELAKEYNLNIKYKTNEMISFSENRNIAISMCNHEWIFWIDTDETYPASMNSFINNELFNLPKNIVGISVNRITMIKDEFHYYPTQDYQVKLFKNSNAEFKRAVHELIHVDGANIYVDRSNNKNIDIPCKHYDLFKSNLDFKFDNFVSRFANESASAGIAVRSNIWQERKQQIIDSGYDGVLELPNEWYDITTDKKILEEW